MQELPPLVLWDWAVIACFFIITLGIGFYFSGRATKSLTEYFVAGRKMTWWVAGTSIVATSFAADTPLVIGGWTRTLGLERNWFWWGSIMGMMLCAFFYARLWRRANILTDVEFNELRYAGKPAAGLRAYHALYRAFVQNTLVMGWVTLAMAKILEVTLNIPSLIFVEGEWLPLLMGKGEVLADVIGNHSIAQWPVFGEMIVPAKATGIILCMTVAVLYTVFSGLWGVMATDLFQFTFAMMGSILLMVFVLIAAGGATNMVIKAKENVRNGQVINKAPLSRAVFPVADLPKPEQKELLLAAGIIRSIPEGQKDSPQWLSDEKTEAVPPISVDALNNNTAPSDQETKEKEILIWSVSGKTEAEITRMLASIGIEDSSQQLINLWRRAYTANKTLFTNFQAVDSAIDAAILAEDFDPAGKPLDYYRFTNIHLSDEDFLDQLVDSGTESLGEIAAVWRGDKVTPVKKITSFFPPFDLRGGGLLAVWSLVVFLGLQWWAASEGGGFLAQRLFSCKNEKHSVLAMLWFNVAHFVLRPWPWIVVGTASLFLVPDVTVYGEHYDYEHAYVIMLMKYLPVGLKGMMVAALMAAYMSTISTHVNFGASYVINDIYKRFLRPNSSHRHSVIASQVISVFLACIAAYYAYSQTTILSGWLTFFELMSGAGLVILVRWYWWRINAWSEISAMTASIGFFMLMNHTPVFQNLFSIIGLPESYLDEYSVRFTLNILCSTLTWLTVTFLTAPEKEEHLVAYYKRLRPAGWWKQSIIDKSQVSDYLKVGKTELTAWAVGVGALFSAIFAVGKLCFGLYLTSIPYFIFSIVAGIFLMHLVGKMDWSGMEDTDSED